MHIPGYRVIRKINQGGMSTVYLAIQISVGRVVALKVMSPTLNGDPAFSERFQREASIVGQLSHPNIVAIYDIGRHENLNYIAMDYLPGGSVHDRMMDGIHTADALRITREIAIALDHAHEKGYIHRDIKPENILFRADHSAVLTDFGVAKGMVGISRMTSVGQVVGTPHYMSPEQTRGKTVDARSDLYSLGVVFYEMLTGSVPFQGDEAVAIAIKHISAPIPRLPRQYQAYQKILDKLLAKDPEQRFQRGRDLVEALETVENSQKIPYGQSANPGDLSTPALFKALLAAAANAVSWRLRKLAQMRWTPQRGFYRYPTAHMTEVLLTGDDARTTAIATRVQQATNVQVFLNPRQRLGLQLGIVAGVLLIIGGGISLLISDKASEDAPLIPRIAMPPAADGASPLAIDPVPAENIGTRPAADAAVTETDNDREELIAADESAGDEADFDERATLEPYPPFPSTADPAAGSSANSAANELVENTADGTQTEEVAPVKPVLFGLTVTPVPEDSLVRILNIGPRYAPGIALQPGRYHIEVSHPGYVTHTSWVTLAAKPLVTEITLEKAPELPRKFSADLGKGLRGPAMVTIDPGSFTMGSETDPATMPTHRVTIPQAFAISQYEITFEQYELFARTTDRALPGDNRWGRENRPVINVSWNDAQAYAQWLSKKTGKTYRLPSESEWEYVARAGSRSAFWWGDEDAAGKANCRRGCNSRYSGLFGSKTAPIGSYGANAFGVYDTAGNVAEWVQDCYVDSYERKPKNGKPLIEKLCSMRVARGGSAKNNLDRIASHVREHHAPNSYDEQLGFRLVMELD